MVPVPDDSTRVSPNGQQTDPPRMSPAGKGGCWTCRLRRKVCLIAFTVHWTCLMKSSTQKCDEQREGDSCKTCLRLTIKCLGWGPRRPEWMRDKQQVEQYKAEIKAQLTRAGLIRGQPRTSQVYPSNSYIGQTQNRPHPYHRTSPPDASTSSYHYPSDYRYMQGQHTHPRLEHSPHNLVSNIQGASNHGFQIPDPLYPTETSMNPLDFYYSQSVTPSSSSSTTSTVGTDNIGPIDYPPSASSQETSFDFDLSPLTPAPTAPIPITAGQNVEDVIYYFEHVRKVQLMFAGNALTNATYSIILQEPRGAVSNAVSALANLHYTRMRVAQGLEAPNLDSEYSYAGYFHREAYFQLATAKQMQNHYTEDDAMAALHLVCYSQLSGGTTEWQPAFRIMCDWLTQTGLLNDETPAITLHTMPPTSQLLIKFTLWLDTLSSFSNVRPPRYLRLLKRLLGEREGYWPAAGETDGLHSLRMDRLTGCPDEAMLALAEVLTLADWKANEQHNGTLSFRELVRRGDDIEQRLRQRQTLVRGLGDTDQAPLHPRLQTQAMESHIGTFPSEEARHLVSRLFCEAAVLSLHTVLSNANPGVAEIEQSVETVFHLLDQLTPSELDRALVFPICLAGSLTDDSNRQDFCKRRLQRLDNSIGNLMQTQLVMEAVWQKRENSGAAVDFRDLIRERFLNLLLI
ncbi:hypothetical protein C0993_008138 [Termitomyces sp. T159_Od127]|nr:hypothetical protein C0993_008138 [Termitomyces sp. T159_Od127]